MARTKQAARKGKGPWDTQIRDLTKELKQPDVTEERKKEIQANLQALKDDKAKAQRENKLKTSDRKKLMGMRRSTEAKLNKAKKEGDVEKIAQLEKELEHARIRVLYTQHYPEQDTYISAFPASDETDSIKSKREAVLESVKSIKEEPTPTKAKQNKKGKQQQDAADNVEKDGDDDDVDGDDDDDDDDDDKHDDTKIDKDGDKDGDKVMKDTKADAAVADNVVVGGDQKPKEQEDVKMDEPKHDETTATDDNTTAVVVDNKANVDTADANVTTATTDDATTATTDNATTATMDNKVKDTADV
eukprot:c10522_g2_i1.p1 GENE.c10522_g2_i1~~c10522_g2_i1.p1  ORF type:complete len:325 (-),score=148.93 c10522_g2_i1:107-1012(-)